MKSSERATGHAEGDAVRSGVAAEPADPLPRTPRPWAGLALRWTTALLALSMFYLLSYGPVRRMFVRTTEMRIPAANGVPEQTVRTSSKPTWIRWVYGPASSLSRTEIGQRLYV